MSLILDALKKLDREKLASRGVSAEIAVEILRPEPLRPAKKIWIYLGTAFAAAIGAATLTYLFMAGLLFSPQSPSSTPINPPVPNQQIAIAIPSQDSISSKKDEAERPVAKMLPLAENRKPEASTDKKKTGGSAITASRDNTPRAGKIAAAYPPAGPVTTSPALKLSGIIWHEAPSERCAVINGIIANEGSLIEGAKVVEILPNRVRLSFNSHPFELTIGQ